MSSRSPAFSPDSVPFQANLAATHPCRKDTILRIPTRRPLARFPAHGIFTRSRCPRRSRPTLRWVWTVRCE